MIKRFHHVGIAVRDLDKAIQFFEETYGAKLQFRRILKDQKIETAFVAMGDARFELSSSLDPQSVIGRFIETKGEGIHHVSLEVDDFNKAMEAIKGKGLRVLLETDAENFKAAFVHPKSMFGVLTEIIETKSDTLEDWV
jgi:methylmalonyl-CoA/ethylmalonyl-CoA epimerase